MKSCLKLCERKNNFFIKFFLEQKYILLSETYFLKILKNSIASEYFFFFFAKPDTKKHKSQRASNAKSSNAALVKLTDWIIKNDHVIDCAMCFCRWFKHSQRSNVIWLSTTWLSIFRLEVTSKKPLFTTKPASISIQISC